MEQEESAQPQRKPKRPSPFAALIPRKNYLVTPILIDLNILVFVIMVLGGANMVNPEHSWMLEAGANMRSLTMNGEWWRLFTAMFLHYGILHLLMNMIALYNIGMLLESLIGKWRFLGLYLATGIAASVSSVWWHDNVASVGASGAILGIAGVLIALLTTPLIIEEVRKSLLRSLGISIGLTLLMGFSGYIDNAGHIGGLLSGMIGGYLIFFDLKKFYYEKKKQYTFFFLALIVIAGLCVMFLRITPESTNINELLNRLEQNDHTAVSYLQEHEDGKGVSPDDYQKQTVTRWESCAAIADSMLDSQDLPDQWQPIVLDLRAYSKLRISGSQYFYRWLTEKDSTFIDSADFFMQKADSAILKINKKMKDKNNE
jgi:rhomboid protease GluP